MVIISMRGDERYREADPANKLISFWRCCCVVAIVSVVGTREGDAVISRLVVIVLLPHYHVLAPLLSILASINNRQIS